MKRKTFILTIWGLIVGLFVKPIKPSCFNCAKYDTEKCAFNIAYYRHKIPELGFPDPCHFYIFDKNMKYPNG